MHVILQKNKKQVHYHFLPTVCQKFKSLTMYYDDEVVKKGAFQAVFVGILHITTPMESLTLFLAALCLLEIYMLMP